ELTLQLKKEILPLRSEIQKYRSELRLELTAEKFDEARVKNLVEQISDLSKQIQLKRTMHQRAIRNLLTPDQQQKYDLHLLSGRKIERRRFDDRPRLMRDPDGPRPDRGFRNR
ncbi:MAG: periplasmic heavy metal sensor, partial [Calditrichaeota bacterium]